MLALIRVLVTKMPRLLHDLVQKLLSRESDIELLFAKGDKGKLLDMIGEAKPDVVIVACDESKISEVGLQFLQKQPKLLAITKGGREALLYELRPRTQPIGELSPESLLAAVRGTRQSSRP